MPVAPLRKVKRALEPEKVITKNGKERYKRRSYGLTGSYVDKIGRMDPKKGRSREGYDLISWDALPDCPGDCPITTKCQFLNATNKCKVMKAYVASAASIIINNYVLDETELMRVGLHLIPLYRNLCRLHILEYSLADITQIVKGKIVIHPVYDSIKAHVKSIEDVWKGLNLNDPLKKKPRDERTFRGSSQIPEVLPKVLDLINGSPDYYESLSDK